jgi:hypothetical protein
MVRAVEIDELARASNRSRRIVAVVRALVMHMQEVLKDGLM